MTVGKEYHPLTIANTEFADAPTLSFDSPCSALQIINDSYGDTVSWSFNGHDVDGELRWDDEGAEITDTGMSRIWFKTSNPAGSAARILARA